MVVIEVPWYLLTFWTIMSGYIIYDVFVTHLYYDYKYGKHGYQAVSGKGIGIEETLQSMKKFHVQFPEMRCFINGARVLFPGDKKPHFVKIFVKLQEEVQ